MIKRSHVVFSSCQVKRGLSEHPFRLYLRVVHPNPISLLFFLLLRRTSRRVKDVVDNVCLSVVVRSSRSLWDDTRNDTERSKNQLFEEPHDVDSPVTHHHTRAATLCHGMDKIQRVCRSADTVSSIGAHWYSGNSNFGAVGTQRLTGLMGQCTSI